MSSRSTLKAALVTGQAITQAKLYDLIDSLAHTSEDSLATDSELAAAIAALTKSSVGLGNVDNTSDANKPVSSAQQTAINAAGAFAIVVDATTARTLVLTDARKYLRCTSGSAVTVTVPPQASIAWAADTEIVIEQSGAGQVTIAAGAGVTLQSSLTLKSAARYAAITLKRTASDIWTVGGERSVS